MARVPARRVRLRLVNGSNARIYDLSFDDGRPFEWIASESGLLEAPVELRSLSLAPGERAEIAFAPAGEAATSAALPARLAARRA